MRSAAANWIRICATALASTCPAFAADLSAESIGAGEIRLDALRGEPVALVLLDRDEVAVATPIATALDFVMLAEGGHRLSVVRLADVWGPGTLIARRRISNARNDSLARVRESGRTLPADLETSRILYLADWEGGWQAALAPTCAGVALVVLDAAGGTATTLCDPSPEEAAKRFRAAFLPKGG